MLGILTEPGLLFTLIPVGVVVLGLVTFEVAVAITISTLPRSRFQQRWSPQEQRRVVRTFALVFCVWPVLAGLVAAHVYLPVLFALIADALVLAFAALAIRWVMHGVHQRKLIMAGHCEQCFYDLRASKDSDHCPECGAALHEHPTRARPRRRTPTGPRPL
jgi:nitrate reductase NapE component